MFHRFSGVSFGGVACAQYWCDFVLWETVLNANPELTGIVEIGTFMGGFSHYLNAQAQARGMKFVTYDAIVPEATIPEFTRLDVFAYPGRVKDWAESCGGPVILFCDGGNKPRELSLFPPLMPEHSVYLVHDWGTEMLGSDVPEFLDEIYGDYCDSIGSVTRVFRMREETE